ncbi:MAG: MG2 domain-containing protein, partial [Steroidobacteraceae bacterium]|nr:MG2 domain-containing protein [Steroidobacteraceae bacterium]MDW8259164.1 MG2 domain-containing protein [Gammaproteobacteria bacterium]
QPAPARPEAPPRSQEDGDTAQASHWDYVQAFGDGAIDWSNRRDPCNAAYYAYGENVRAARNVLASNIGLLAKRDRHGRLWVAATDLASAAPLAGAQLSVRNYQNQEIGRAVTDRNGLAQLTSDGTPFLLVATAQQQRGYLKLASGAALPVSHFDVGGATVTRGLKGYLYGERGVWRPGDTLYLTFVLQDKERTLPPDHPVTLELRDPRGRLVESQVNTRPSGGFYAFALRTAPDAPTGDWTAKAIVGDTEFTRRVKIETVMPNRLRIALDLGGERLEAGAPLRGTLASEWLSGASAAGLKADVTLRLAPLRTSFTSFRDFVFDDPAREFRAEPLEIFSGEL